MALFLGTPKLESRNCPEIVPVGVLGLWELITPNCRVRLQRHLNQSVALFESFLTPCCTLNSDVGKRSIPDF
jgi:hypothetical protein